MSITLTTIDASSAAIAWKLAPPTPLPTGTASRSPVSMPATWCIAKNRCWPPCRRIWEPTQYSIAMKWELARLRCLYRGAKLQQVLSEDQTPVPQRAGVCACGLEIRATDLRGLPRLKRRELLPLAILLRADG